MSRTWLFVMALIAAFSSRAQSGHFDLISYDAPPGYVKTEAPGVLLFIRQDEKKGIFCMITAYEHQPSLGSTSKDFSAAWKTVVADRLGIKQEPASEDAGEQNGWVSRSGNSSFDYQGKKALAVLTTMTGHGSTMSFLVVANDGGFQDDLEKYFASITFDAANAVPGPSNAAVIVTAPSGPAPFGEYFITVPTGWKRSDGKDEVVLTAYDKVSVLSVMPPIQGTGNLERDADDLFWQYFKGWRKDPANPDHHIWTRGVSHEGWAWYKMELGITANVKDGIAQVIGVLFLADLGGGREAVVLGSCPAGGGVLGEQMHADWAEFIHGLSFKGRAGVGNSLSSKLVGTWMSGGMSGLSSYTFEANGNFSSGAAFSTRRSAGDFAIEDKTVSVANLGKWILNGNKLHTVNDRGVTEDCTIRLFEEREFTDEWHPYLGMLKKSVVDGKLYELRITREKK